MWVFFFYLKTNYEVFTPIFFKTSNTKPNYFILHVHICVYSTWMQTYIFIYRCILKLCYTLRELVNQVIYMYQGKLIHTLWLCHTYGYYPCKMTSFMFFNP